MKIFISSNPPHTDDFQKKLDDFVDNQIGNIKILEDKASQINYELNIRYLIRFTKHVNWENIGKQSELLILLSSTLKAQKRHVEAEQYIIQAIQKLKSKKLCPVNAYFKLIELCVERNKFGEAFKYCKIALNIALSSYRDSKSESSAYLLAQAYQTYGLAKKAKGLASSSLFTAGYLLLQSYPSLKSSALFTELSRACISSVVRAPTLKNEPFSNERCPMPPSPPTPSKSTEKQQKRPFSTLSTLINGENSPFLGKPKFGEGGPQNRGNQRIDVRYEVKKAMNEFYQETLGVRFQEEINKLKEYSLDLEKKRVDFLLRNLARDQQQQTPLKITNEITYVKVEDKNQRRLKRKMIISASKQLERSIKRIIFKVLEIGLMEIAKHKHAQSIVSFKNKGKKNSKESSKSEDISSSFSSNQFSVEKYKINFLNDTPSFSHLKRSPNTRGVFRIGSVIPSKRNTHLITSTKGKNIIKVPFSNTFINDITR